MPCHRVVHPPSFAKSPTLRLPILQLLILGLLTGPVASQTPASEAQAPEENPTPEETPTVNGVQQAHLRIARPTDDLAPVVAFYRDGLGFEVLGSFEDHDGFDGVMLGHSGAGYHLELTHQRGHPVGRAPNPEHLLVFYLPDAAEFQAAIDRLRRQGHEPVVSNNPYWDRRGKTFEDPDGYRVVLQNSAW